MAGKGSFEFDDTAIVDDNLALYGVQLTTLDATLGPALSAVLPSLGTDAIGEGVLDQLIALVVPAKSEGATGKTTGTKPPATKSAAAAGTSSPKVGWFLEGLTVEGFRGINNEGTALSLRFKPDAVNSVSAPNGVGKSSLYDAVMYALSGRLPKLDSLLQAERPQDYYLNRFHAGGIGTIGLTLKPDDGGKSVTVTIWRNKAGVRTVTASGGIDGDELLADLNREFVLLDGQLFRSFIDANALERGRNFSGLLGLARYSELRQALQGLCNTRAFNSHFDVSAHARAKADLERRVGQLKASIAKDYNELVKKALEPTTPREDAQKDCARALHGIPVLKESCEDRTFLDIDVEKCIEAVKAAEGGSKRERLAEVIREEKQWSDADADKPTVADIDALAQAAEAREAALAETAGEVFQEFYGLAEKIISDEKWPGAQHCPACGDERETSVLDKVKAKLAQYEAVMTATKAVADAWADGEWEDRIALERLALVDGETLAIKGTSKLASEGALGTKNAKTLKERLAILRERAKAKRAALATERAALEKELPPSLVTVTTAIEGAKRLQKEWKELASAEDDLGREKEHAERVERLKGFLDAASEAFARAEADLASTRLKKVLPRCQDLFKNVMFSPVVPGLSKPEGREDLAIRLEEFWGIRDVSAQALLSESYRNAFAVSVYLADAIQVKAIEAMQRPTFRVRGLDQRKYATALQHPRQLFGQLSLLTLVERLKPERGNYEISRLGSERVFQNVGFNEFDLIDAAPVQSVEGAPIHVDEMSTAVIDAIVGRRLKR